MNYRYVIYNKEERLHLSRFIYYTGQYDSQRLAVVESSVMLLLSME